MEIGGCDVVFATAKGRATGASWSPVRFTGFGYEDSPDGGMSVTSALEPDGEGNEDRQKKRELRQQQEDQERSSKQEQAKVRRSEEMTRLMDQVCRVIEKNDGIGTKRLRELVGVAAGCGREKVEAAITSCEEVGRITVDRRNVRDHQHHVSRQFVQKCTPVSQLSEMAQSGHEREWRGKTPPIPPLWARHTRHTGGGR